MKKQIPTLFLKGAVCFIAAVVLAACVAILVQMIREGFSPDYPMLLGIVVVMELSAIPFFIALYQGFRLLRYIDKRTAFSEESVQALKKITSCAVTIALLYTAGMPNLYALAQGDDAPGVVLLGIIFAFVSIVIAVFSAVLQKLVRQAIDLQSENELTV